MPQIYSKQSFERFGDDLTEVLLSYISFEDSFHYKCVSKQWKRLVFNKQNKLIIECENNDMRRTRNIGEIPKNHLKIKYIKRLENHYELKTIEIILKNCPNITSIVINNGFKTNINLLFELIIKYCNNLYEIEFTITAFTDEPLSLYTIIAFCHKFGSELKKIKFKKLSDTKVKHFLRFCPNLTHLSIEYLNHIFDGNEVFVKN